MESAINELSEKARQAKEAAKRLAYLPAEIKDRGGEYSCDVHLLQEEKARPDLAEKMGLSAYSTVYHSVLVHKENEVPIQLSSRFINPEIAPDYLKQDFTATTPNE